MANPFDLFGRSFGTQLFGVPEPGAGRLFDQPPVPGMPLTGGPGGSSGKSISLLRAGEEPTQAPTPPGAGPAAMGLLDQPPAGGPKQISMLRAGEEPGLLGGPRAADAPAPGAQAATTEPHPGAAGFTVPPAPGSTAPPPMVSMNPLTSPMLGGGAKTLPAEAQPNVPQGSPVGPKGVPPYIPPTVQHNIPASDAGPGTHMPTAPVSAQPGAPPATAPAGTPATATPPAGAPADAKPEGTSFSDILSRFGDLKVGGAGGGTAPSSSVGGIGGDPAAASRSGAGQLFQGILEAHQKALPDVGGVPKLPEPLMRRYRGMG